MLILILRTRLPQASPHRHDHTDAWKQSPHEEDARLNFQLESFKLPPTTTTRTRGSQRLIRPGVVDTVMDTDTDTGAQTRPHRHNHTDAWKQSPHEEDARLNFQLESFKLPPTTTTRTRGSQLLIRPGVVEQSWTQTQTQAHRHDHTDA